MTCTNPKTIYIRHSHPIDFNTWAECDQHKYNKAKMTWHKGYIELKVPCGECLGCKLDHANEWATRCTIEAKNWKNACMITLTYNDKHLPKTKTGKPTLCKEDVQKFIKRLRKKYKGMESWINPKTLKVENPIRYFYCGEYGTKRTKRPHYHMILFNWQPNDMQFYKYNKHGDVINKSHILQNLWGNGFVTVEEMNYNTACYVARYCTKKAGLNKKQIKVPLAMPKIDNKGIHTEYYKFKEKPLEMYINMSTGVGIGLKYWLDNIDFLKKWQYIELKVNDKIIQKQLPRYFKKKWNEKDWENYEQAKYDNFIRAEKQKDILLEQDNYDKELSREEQWKQHLKKIEEKLYRKCQTAGILNRNDIDETNDVTTQPQKSQCDFHNAYGEQPTNKFVKSAYDERWERIIRRWNNEDAKNDLYQQIFKNSA